MSKCFKDAGAECPSREVCERDGCQYQRNQQQLKDQHAAYTRAPGRLAQPNTVGTPPPDPVTETIRTRFLARQRVGWTRYGIGLGREDFTMDNWLQHLEEELMDALQYTVRLRMTRDGSLKVQGSSEDVKITQELPAQEIARLTREISERQARVMRLVGGDPTKGVRVPVAPVVYSHPTCIFHYCPSRQECEPRNTCVHQLQSQNQEPAEGQSAPGK